MRSDEMVIGVRARDAKIADDLVQYAKRTSPNGRIETTADWDVLKVLFAFWAKQWPGEYVLFKESVDVYREAYTYNIHGVKEDKGGASLQHFLEMPESFYFLLHKFFPSQQLTREFTRKLVDEVPEFRMHKFSKI